MVTEPKALDDLVTEARAPTGADHDLRSTAELVELMNRQDASVPAAVEAARAQITAAIEEIVARLARGGRLIYVGAGSSGRIAALDAAECESTFSTEPGQVVALVAGGVVASPAVQAAAEDGAEVGAAEVAALGAGEADAVVGISASGRTPYVLGALRAAADAGALTVALVSVPDSELSRIADHELAADDRRLDAEPHAETALRMLPPAASSRARAASASIPARSETIATFALPCASSSARSASSSDAPVAWRTMRRTRSRSFSFVACTSTMRSP